MNTKETVFTASFFVVGKSTLFSNILFTILGLNNHIVEILKPIYFLFIDAPFLFTNGK